MAAPTQIFTTNIGNINSSPLNSAVTLAPHTFITADVTNGVQIVDAFVNVDASLLLLFRNPSLSTGAVVTLLQGTNSEGTSNDGLVTTNTGLGNVTITLPPNSEVAYSIVDSSLFAQNISYTDSAGVTAVYPGMALTVTSTDVSNAVTISALVKYPTIYAGPAAY